MSGPATISGELAEPTPSVTPGVTLVDPTPDAPSAADELTDETAPTPPPGAEYLQPAHTLLRSVRGAILEAVDPIQDQLTRLADADVDDQADARTLNEIAGSPSKALKLIGAMEDAMRLVAYDPEAFDEWCLAVTESAIVDLYMHMLKAMDLGKA